MTDKEKLALLVEVMKQIARRCHPYKWETIDYQREAQYMVNDSQYILRKIGEDW